MPPVSVTEMRSVRYTRAAATRPVEDTSVTGPILATICGEVVGRCAASPKNEVPGPTDSRLVPRASSCRSTCARLDVAMPTTATMAAMPIAMPRADSTTRNGRARRPAPPTRTTSRMDSLTGSSRRASGRGGAEPRRCPGRG